MNPNNGRNEGDQELRIPDDEDEEEMSDSSVEENNGLMHEHTFDNDLPLKHTYLSCDEELSGRTLLEEGSIHVMPLVKESDIVLVPGQTLPLTFSYAPIIESLRATISVSGTRTFGVVSSRVWESNAKVFIGTTAEIYAYCDTDNGEFRIKAKGRQRFKILQPSAGRNNLVKVQVLPEIVLPTFLNEISPVSAHKRRSRAKDNSNAMMTPWPRWVYDMYDGNKLVARVKLLLSYLENKGGSFNIPNDPVELSFWVAQNIPLDDHQKLELLSLDSALQRLRMELTHLERLQILCCKQCSAHIADTKDAFAMSVEGPQNVYVNPAGFVHETLTLHRASGLVFQQTTPSYEFSWFPGYGWTCVECKNCWKHMGWLFTTTKPELYPKSFFGLSRHSLFIKLHPEPRLPNPC